MLRKHPTDDYDRQHAEELRAEAWMLDALRANPEYVWWGPHEDGMMENKHYPNSWSNPIFYSDWSDFGPWTLNDMNEVVHFYFGIERDHVPCPEECGGYNRETKKLSNDWYDFANTGARWCDKLTQDEVDALREKGRLWQFDHEPTAAEVNARSDLHDSINHWICLETRARRLGIWGLCPVCGGSAILYTSETARLTLTLWVLVPRKGLSRALEIARIERDELPAVAAFLEGARQRNDARFGKLGLLAPEMAV